MRGSEGIPTTRRRSAWVLVVSAVALVVSLAGVVGILMLVAVSILAVADHGDPDVNFTSGNGATEAFTDHMQAYQLQLPADAQEVKWVERRDFGVNARYLSFLTSRGGLDKVLGTYGVSASDLGPTNEQECRSLPELGCRALPRADVWAERFPARFIAWGPSAWARVRVTNQEFEPDADRGAPYVSLLVDQTDRERPQVFVVSWY